MRFGFGPEMLMREHFIGFCAYLDRRHAFETEAHCVSKPAVPGIAETKAIHESESIARGASGEIYEQNTV
jgi:hypothetical protein